MSTVLMFVVFGLVFTFTLFALIDQYFYIEPIDFEIEEDDVDLYNQMQNQAYYEQTDDLYMHVVNDSPLSPLYVSAINALLIQNGFKCIAIRGKMNNELVLIPTNNSMDELKHATIWFMNRDYTEVGRKPLDN